MEEDIGNNEEFMDEDIGDEIEDFT